MYKFKTTKEAMKEEYSSIVAPSHIEYLLTYESPFAYSIRAEGWACDYYDVGGTLVSIGYDPLRPVRSQNSYFLERPYEDEARDVVESNELEYEEKKMMVKALLEQYVKEASQTDRQYLAI